MKRTLPCHTSNVTHKPGIACALLNGWTVARCCRWCRDSCRCRLYRRPETKTDRVVAYVGFNRCRVKTVVIGRTIPRCSRVSAVVTRVLSFQLYYVDSSKKLGCFYPQILKGLAFMSSRRKKVVSKIET